MKKLLLSMILVCSTMGQAMIGPMNKKVIGDLSLDNHSKQKVTFVFFEAPGYRTMVPVLPCSSVDQDNVDFDSTKISLMTPYFHVPLTLQLSQPDTISVGDGGLDTVSPYDILAALDITESQTVNVTNQLTHSTTITYPVRKKTLKDYNPLDLHPQVVGEVLGIELAAGIGFVVPLMMNTSENKIRFPLALVTAAATGVFVKQIIPLMQQFPSLTGCFAQGVMYGAPVGILTSCLAMKVGSLIK